MDRPIRVLECFSGTGSVSKFCAKYPGWFQVTSLDIVGVQGFEPTIKGDILDWDYRALPADSFDLAWFSPPCTQYSNCRQRGPARDLEGADKLVKRVLEIIDYFKPIAWFIENPYTGLLRHRDVIAGVPYFRVDYCQYDKPILKPTCIFTNLTTFVPKKCPRVNCVQQIPGTRKHTMCMHGENAIAAQIKTSDKWKMGAIPHALLADLFRRAGEEALWWPAF